MTRSPKRMRVPGEIHIPEPPVGREDPPVTSPVTPDRRFWPLDRPTPTVWIRIRRMPLPCPKCRRVLLDDGGQNSVCKGTHQTIAYFRCKSCQHVWKMKVQET